VKFGELISNFQLGLATKSCNKITIYTGLSNFRVLKSKSKET
jgi:hypothetical protein